MNNRFRLFCYFCAAAFPAFTAAAANAHLVPSWATAVTSAFGAGFVALVAYFDHSEDHHNPPPPPGVPA